MIIRDDYDHPDLPRIAEEFSRWLLEFGYPSCPGNIMINNSEWRRPLRGFRDMIWRWIRGTDEAAYLNLAIFYDAAPVAGDHTLLADAKQYLHERMGDNGSFFAYFARPTLNFDTPTGLLSSWFGERGGRHQLDVKKAGIFPLVHGVRSLALENRMIKTNTLDRLWGLCDAKVLDRDFTTELAAAFTAMQSLRLKAWIDGNGIQSDNVLRLDDFSKADRDLLRESLLTVKQFKELITYHFRLTLF
ncbi:CBS domain-containing protein [Azospirillaceae bacterium]